jgi:hypothetical protein
MALTVLVKTYVIDNLTTLDATIAGAAFIGGLTIAHVYGFAVIPLSNTQSRLIIIYD